jgi:hypothetical protein
VLFVVWRAASCCRCWGLAGAAGESDDCSTCPRMVDPPRGRWLGDRQTICRSDDTDGHVMEIFAAGDARLQSAIRPSPRRRTSGMITTPSVSGQAAQARLRAQIAHR